MYMLRERFNYSKIEDSDDQSNKASSKQDDSEDEDLSELDGRI